MYSHNSDVFFFFSLKPKNYLWAKSPDLCSIFPLNYHLFCGMANLISSLDCSFPTLKSSVLWYLTDLDSNQQLCITFTVTLDNRNIIITMFKSILPHGKSEHLISWVWQRLYTPSATVIAASSHIYVVSHLCIFIFLINCEKYYSTIAISVKE